MCFEFGCFGGGRREDYGGEWAARKEPQGRGRRGNRGNGAHHSVTADHKAPPPAYNNLPHAAVEEAGHKAYHDVARKDHHAATVTNTGGHGGYAAYVQDKAAEYYNPKRPAWHNKVGDDAVYTYSYTPRLHETPAHHKENGTTDYHRYPATTTNTTLVRY